MKAGKGNKEGNKQEESVVALEVDFADAENVPIQYVSNMFVSHGEDVFLLTFAQAHGPYLTKTTKEQLSKIGKIPARVVARLAIPPSNMKEILDVLNRNYEGYERSKKKV